jgi:L-serine dehydratase
LRLPESLEYAKQIGLQVIFRLVHDTAYHPNTVRIVNRSQAQEATEVVGSSLGGGKIEIAEVDGFPVRLSGDRPGLVLWHRDQPGFLAAVLGRLAQQNVNVARLTLDRTHRGAMALAAIELDEALAEPSTELWAPVQQLVIKHRWLTPV